MKLAHLAARIGLLALTTTLVTGSPGSATAQVAPLPALSLQYVDQILEVGNLAIATSLIAPEAVLVTPEGEFVGPAGASAFNTTLQESFGDLEFEVTAASADGEDLQIAFTMTGIQTGTYLGIPAHCATITVPGTATLDVENGMIQGQQVDYDQHAMSSQAARFNRLASFEGYSCDTWASGSTKWLEKGATQMTSDDGPASFCREATTCSLP